MLVAIHQLHYLPWLRYFEKIHHCGLFIALDNIQFNKNGFQNRNRVKTSNGTNLLTVPVYAKNGQRLDEVRINNTVDWRKKHWRTIDQNYAKAPHFETHRPFLEDTYRREWDCLNRLNRHMLEYFVQALGIETPIVYASSLDVSGQATGRLIELIQAVGGNAYYSGEHAVGEYLDTEALQTAGIDLESQQWTAPRYPQRYEPFVSDLSILDLLLNGGPESLKILTGETD